jgi:hypothetical protein
MYDSQRYRDKAAECLRSAQQARDPVHRAVHLSMALSWLSLARQDEAGVWFSKASLSWTSRCERGCHDTQVDDQFQNCGL